MSQIVVHFTDASTFGGAEQMIVTLLAGLDRRRWNPILLHHGEAGLGELIERSRQLNVQTVEVARNETRRAIGRFLRQARPAIFHAHLNWPLACSDGLLAAALARIPGVVATQQLFVPLESRRRVFRHKLLSMAVDRYIAVSHHMAKMLREVCVFGDKKVRVVHNGIPLAPFQRGIRGDLRERLAGRNARPIVLTLARLARQKGIEYLIEAASRVPGALFAVAGDGPERAALEAKADACGVRERVVFLGHRRDVPELLASCDAFVLPSLYEGLPVSVLEAMAAAKPVIATGVGGTDEAVKDGVTGLLVPPADPAALAEAIHRLLADSGLAERLGAQARDWVRREFSAELVAARTMEVYEELAEPTRPPNEDSLKRAVNAFTPGSEGSSEEARNRLLRRTDWRFLLPDPSPDKTICFAGDPLLESVRLISGAVVDGRNGGEVRDCDLAVAVEPDRETLARARLSLRPGGFLYSEWRGLLRRGREHARRTLESAGFEDASFCWPHPDPAVANPAAWLPLPGVSVLRHYFVKNRGRSRTPLRRAVRWVMRTVSAAAPRLRLAQPVCALARKPTALVGPSRGGLNELVASRWAGWGLGPAPKSLSWLLLTGGLRSNSKVIALVFADSNPRPVIALKMPRTQESAPAIGKEASVLRALPERLGTAAPQGIPRLLFVEERGGVPVLGETAFTGVRLLNAWTRDNYCDLALKASGWVADLAGRRPASPPEEWWHRLVGTVLGEFASAFGRVLDSRLLHESEALLRTMPPLPLVCEQRDFSPWNVLLTPAGELAVVDWESAELEGLPALDLIYFLACLCFLFDKARLTGRYRESYRSMLDPDTPRGSLAARCFSVYRNRLGLDSAAFRPLRLLTWLVHSRSEYQRLQADFGQTPSTEILRQAVCVGLWEEELRRGAEVWG